ncbi:protein transport protein Sec24B isoform X3 [Rana temporaria]|uniref:protein transport protein Sec24B isoform X3 n=1 Tax=Rana temporaria TaxID=8407 RepID=UPI001AAC99F2|nr:protein transport protein Sec24B isoform X3 [Rana temporaria]
MSATGPPAAQQNGPSQPQPTYEYRNYPSTNNASPAFYSQVPSKVTPSYTSSQYAPDFYYSNYAALPSRDTVAPPVHTNHLNANQGSHLSGHGLPSGDHVSSSLGPGQGTVPPKAPVHSYPDFNYAYSAPSSCPPQGLPAHSSHYSAPVVSNPLYQGAQYSSMPASSQYGQVVVADSLQSANQVTGNVQRLQTATASTLHHNNFPRQSAPLAPSAEPRKAQAGQVQNRSLSFAPTNQQSTSVSSAFHGTEQKPGLTASAPMATYATTTKRPSEPASLMSSLHSPPPAIQQEMPAATNTAHVNAIQHTSRPSKPFGHGYPALQPGYQNSASPHGSQSNTPVHQPVYPQYPSHYGGINQLPASLSGLSLQQAPQPEGLRPMNLIQDRNVLPVSSLPPPAPNLNTDLKKLNCNPEFFRCTLTSVPQTQALLNKAKLPLGLLLHPFKSKPRIPTISSSSIIRCRSCRTYINPFVSFIDQRRWKCNLCYRVNDVPEEFMYNPVTRSYGEPHKQTEVLSSSVEFVASSDYMLRPPPPAVYLFVLDVSYNAIESGYLQYFAQSLLENLDKLRGDSRTKIGFITFDSTVHFYNLQEGLSQPQMLIVSDVDEIFLPTPDGLLVNLHESKELIRDLLTALPSMFLSTRETHSALGPALQGAFKLMSPTGGRISVFQTQLPSLGAGQLQSREDPNQRSSTKGIQHLGPATDFYKKLALDCSGQQTAVDLFLLSSQYSDLASLACMSKYSAGCIYYYPSFHHKHNTVQADKLKQDLDHYLTRKVGFEAVMRIRCTKGLSIHTFHGNFFVRSTDLLSLANINEDAGFAVQMSIDESLTDTSLACFQVALLYTSSKGQRRIRVHTLCLPVVNSLPDVLAGADVQAVTSLLANMAVDRSISSSISDARDALVNAVVDSLLAYNSSLSNLQPSALIAPNSLKMFPLYILALLKQKAFRTGTSTRLDDRVFAMCQIKYQPIVHLMKMIHPSLYRIDRLTDEGAILVNDQAVPQPPLQHLSAEKLEREGAFLMDAGSALYLWIGRNCDAAFLNDVLGFPNYASVPPKMSQLPELDTLASERTRSFISWLQRDSPLNPVLHVLKDDSVGKTDFFQHLIEDRSEAAFSYYEFLLHVQQQICK